MRVDLVDPGSEGLALRAVLRDGGLDVESRELADLLETSADVVVLAGDTPGALEALRRLRDDGARPDVPVVLVGAPPGLEPRSDGPAFGAEWTLGRDAAADRLVRIVREVAARAVVLGAPRGLRERTLDLGREESQIARVRDGDDGSRRIAPVSDVAPAPEPGSGEIALRAPISLELEAILRAGAARAFPDAEDVDVSLPAGEESARDLVPDEFVAVGWSDEEESPGDSLTFVGGPAPLAEVRSGRTPAGAGTPGGVRKTSAGASDDGQRAQSERTRSSLGTHSSLPPRPQLGVRPPKERGALTTGADVAAAGEGSVLEFLRAMFGITPTQTERAVRVRAGAETLELTFSEGLLTHARAALASRTLTALGQRAAANESDAEARIEALVLGGLVSPARRARALETVTRAALDAVLGERRIEWLEVPPAEVPAARVLSQPLERELADAAARAVSRGRAAELLGGPTTRLVRGRSWERGATSIGISTALDAALGSTGLGVTRLWAALEDEPGLAGRLVALVALGALEVRGLDPDVPEDLAARARARALVEELRRRADDSDYFALLGLMPSASAEQVGVAFVSWSERLLALDLDALGLGAIAGDRDIALAALGEARRVLSRQSWREAYVSALLSG